MRILWALLVVIIGCTMTFVAAAQLGTIGDMVAGRTVGTGLRMIVGAGGVALTVALAFSAARATGKSPSA